MSHLHTRLVGRTRPRGGFGGDFMIRNGSSGGRAPSRGVGGEKLVGRRRARWGSDAKKKPSGCSALCGLFDDCEVEVGSLWEVEFGLGFEDEVVDGCVEGFAEAFEIDIFGDFD
jgi:hypothetical protein